MWITVEHNLMVVDHQCAVDRIFRTSDQFRVMRGEHHLLVVTEQGLRHMRGRHLIKPLVGSSATITAGEKLNAEAIASRWRFSLSNAEAGSRATAAKSKCANRLPIIA